MKIKILVISNTPWSTDNSFGNSFSNIFEGMDNLEFANIYCRYGKPKNSIKGQYFQITEKSLLLNLKNKKNPSGKRIDSNILSDQLFSKQESVYNYARKKRYQFLFWLRDIIWYIGRWKSPEMIKFIEEFNPDLIFQPLYYSTYINRIVLYAKKITQVPMVCYVSDDVYTLKHFSLSLFFWIDRFIKRKIIKRVVDNCEYLYVISQTQKNDYEVCFNKKCKILTKGSNFINFDFKKKIDYPIKIIYTGNVGGGRWETISILSKAISEINKESLNFQLFIYTSTPLSNRLIEKMNVKDSVFFMGAVPSEMVYDIQSNADILLHVEPTDLHGRLLVRHSFSTKLIDYFYAGRTILAIGWPGAASIDYLVRNEAGIVANDRNSIKEKLQMILDNLDLLDYYALKAWECGRTNHQICEIQQNLNSDFSNLVSKSQS